MFRLGFFIFFLHSLQLIVWNLNKMFMWQCIYYIHRNYHHDSPQDICRFIIRCGDPRSIREGELSSLRQQASAHKEGLLDRGGGPTSRRLHQGPWPWELEVAPQIGGAAAEWKELSAAVDELLAPWPQARQIHRAGRRAHHQAPRAPREQVYVTNYRRKLWIIRKLELEQVSDTYCSWSFILLR